MKDRTFIYDLEKECWRECHDSTICQPDIGDVPLIPVVTCNYERTGEEWRKAWCSLHTAYEEIENYTEEMVITRKGCHLKGIAIPMTYDVSQYTYHEPNMSIRWQVKHNKDENEIYLVKNQAYFKFYWDKSVPDGEIIPVPIKVSVDDKQAVLSLKEKTFSIYGYLPHGVLRAALETLQEIASMVYGFTPKFIMPSCGQKECMRERGDGQNELWLRAFLKHPCDMSISFFENMFECIPEFNYDELFPCEQRDNFPTLARVLQLEPTNELYRLYKTNPLAIIFRMILKDLGIEKEELLKKFDHLHSFCGKITETGYRNRLFPSVSNGNEAFSQDKNVKEYENLRFYVKWLRNHISEEQLAERLLLAQNKWMRWKYTALELFREHFNDIPKNWKDDIIKFGLTEDMRNNLGVLENHLTLNRDDFNYSDDILKLQCNINGYNFRLIPSIERFKRINSNLGMSHYGIYDYTKKGTALFLVERNGRYIGSFVLQGSSVISKAFVNEHRNDILQAKYYIILMFWLTSNGLELKNAYINEEIYKALEQDFVVKPVDKDERWDNMSLMDMTKLTYDKAPPGFYLSYYRKVTECNLIPPHAPSPQEDEQEYLTRELKLCKPIYDGAFEGNPEAQYVMSLFYRDGVGTSFPSYRLSDRWYRKAVASGWLDNAPARSDVRVTGFLG